MKTYKYFIYFQSTYQSGLTEDNNCIIILNHLISDDLHIQNIQNQISESLTDCNKVIIKNFKLLYTNNGYYGDLK